LRARQLGFVFQSFQLLGHLSALENVMLPLELLGARDARERATEMLRRVGLGERLYHLPKLLSGGEQQATAIGRALMSNPRLLMLDEVSLGLAPVVVEQIYAAMPAITGNGTTVLLVEQDVNQALKVADRVQCLLEGRTVLEGTAGSLSRDTIASAYFGI
jgi:ABC-type branched-subunit amino acid transport system ATPase component